ncbi:hypothetical protein [Roseivirga misakiensis]|uniref:Adhesin domain-containing protein n=1 Tax=Roseivirga misakiensis TaxID=1563681 RepID=A0A1E5SLJ5_9BACT|nr:hypothetical protein [Roseivirga misakiensis]OEJ99992.1 hypothetical protein BFP71_10640 [Roseivirga misakiensis]
MKRSIITTLFMLFVIIGQAQEQSTKSFPLKSAKEVSLDFEYPQIVKIKTWDKDEVQVISKLDINEGKDNDNFTLRSTSEGGRLTISSKLTGLSKYDGVYMSSSDDYEDHKQKVFKNGKRVDQGNGNRNKGVEIFIVVEVTVPKNRPLTITAKYGLVEVVDLPIELFVDAHFGGADLTIKENNIGFLTVSSSWGQLFSDLNSDFNIKGNDMPGKKMIAELSTKKNGNKVNVETRFGNVFLRKN